MLIWILGTIVICLIYPVAIFFVVLGGLLALIIWGIIALAGLIGWWWTTGVLILLTIIFVWLYIRSSRC